MIEVAVNWQEIDGTFPSSLPQPLSPVTKLNLFTSLGSKLVPVFSWLQMGRDIVFIRLCYVFGIWSILPRYQKLKS